MGKKTKKRKSSNDSSKENRSQNSNDSNYSNKSNESNEQEEEDKNEEKSEKSTQSLNEDQKKLLSARKQLHNMALAYDAQKEGEPFSKFLEKKRKAEDGIDQLAIEAKLDSDSIKSLTAFLEDNSFSKLNSDSEGGDEDYAPEKSAPKSKKSDNKKKSTKPKKSEGKKSSGDKGSKSSKKNKNKKGKKSEKSEKNNDKKTKGKNDGKLLDGKFVTFTGAMIVSKEGLKQILVNLGAKITSTVSSNTNILIHGDYLEDGRPYDKGKKYKLAKNKKIDIYSDREFEQYMEELTGEKWRMKDEVDKLSE